MVSPALPLVLGSASPARLETLRRPGVAPYVLVSEVDEDAVVAQARSQYGELAPEDVALVLARAKCEAVAARLAGADAPGDAPDGALVVGCDSVLELDGEVHGKPADAAEALARWQRMRGRSGVLHTGHWVIDGPRRRRHRRDARRRGLHDGALRRRSPTTRSRPTSPPASRCRSPGAFTLDGLGGPYVERDRGRPPQRGRASACRCCASCWPASTSRGRPFAAEPPCPMAAAACPCYPHPWPVSPASSRGLWRSQAVAMFVRVMPQPTAVPPGTHAAQPSTPLRDREQAEGYVAMVCFKHGPPRLHGVELERTLHDLEHPTRPVDIARLRVALGHHTPATLDPASPHAPLAHGSLVTVEPGGQVEISTPPHAALDTVVEHTRADSAQLAGLLQAQGLTLGSHGLDPHRPPRRILATPALHGDGAGLRRDRPRRHADDVQQRQPAGLPGRGRGRRLPSRWAAAHALGPPLIALFANSRHHAGADTRWASARLRSVLRHLPAGHPAAGRDGRRPGAATGPASPWRRR